MKLKITDEGKNVLSKDQLKNTVGLLQQGGIIAFPTETVYALAGDARNLSAIKRLFELKYRPLSQPFSVLLPKNDDFSVWARDISPIAQRLASYFWPGPLTLVFNKQESVLSELTGGGNKIGLRVPDHPMAQAILNAFGGGLAAPSANRATQLSPTLAQHVRLSFAGELDRIIDGGGCSVGIESTIVDVTTTPPKLLRLGAISQAAIQQVINLELINDFPAIQGIRLPLQWVETDELENVVCGYLQQGKSVGVLARCPAHLMHKNLLWITMPEAACEYSQVLYQHLRELEQASTDQILVESLPTNPLWLGIHARLAR